MSTFSSLFQSGTAFYGDPFGPIIDTVASFGWSLLPGIPQLGGGGGGHVGWTDIGPSPPIDFGIPDVPVARDSASYPASERELRPIFSGSVGEGPRTLPFPVGGGSTSVRRQPAESEGPTYSTAGGVESYEEGDFPAGSIFAPGRAWGDEVEAEDEFDSSPDLYVRPGYRPNGQGSEDAPPWYVWDDREHGLDTATETEDDLVAIDWGGIFETGIEILSGQAPWQIAGMANPQQSLSFAPPNIAVVPPPSGIPGQPSTVYGYSGGKAVTDPNCGNRRYVTLDRETGKISCRRRRRRRLLTNRDLADLASLKTIVGGGAALNAAVVRAVR